MPGVSAVRSAPPIRLALADKGGGFPDERDEVGLRHDVRLGVVFDLAEVEHVPEEPGQPAALAGEQGQELVAFSWIADLA